MESPASQPDEFKPWCSSGGHRSYGDCSVCHAPNKKTPTTKVVRVDEALKPQSILSGSLFINRGSFKAGY